MTRFYVSLDNTEEQVILEDEFVSFYFGCRLFGHRVEGHQVFSIDRGLQLIWPPLSLPQPIYGWALLADCNSHHLVSH